MSFVFAGNQRPIRRVVTILTELSLLLLLSVAVRLLKVACRRSCVSQVCGDVGAGKEAAISTNVARRRENVLISGHELSDTSGSDVCRMFECFLAGGY
jgi:hypothetical protein